MALDIIVKNSCCVEVGCCCELMLLNFGVFGLNYLINRPNHDIMLIMLLFDRIEMAKYDDQLLECDSLLILLHRGHRKIVVLVLPCLREGDSGGYRNTNRRVQLR